jgi:hypothetical protein
MSYKEYTVRVYDIGTKRWFLDDKLHREDGPAVEWSDGSKRWFLNGKEYTEAEFKAKMAPVKEYTVADIERLLGHSVKIVKD